MTLCREQGDDLHVAQLLISLSDTKRQLGLHKEGIPRAKEVFEICGRLRHIPGLLQSLKILTWLLYGSNQLEVAEEAMSWVLDLYLSAGDQYQVSQCHYLLGRICQSKGRTEATITTSRWPFGLHPVSTCTMHNFGVITSWQSYFLTKAGLVTHTLTSNTPSHMRSIICTTWVAQCICTPTFCQNMSSPNLSVQDLAIHSHEWLDVQPSGRSEFVWQHLARREQLSNLETRYVPPVRRTGQMLCT